MKTVHVFMVCLTWFATHALHDVATIREAEAQAEVARALRPFSQKPSVEIVPNEGSTL